MPFVSCDYLCLLAAVIAVLTADQGSNQIEGVPEVKCTEDGLTVWLRTWYPFHGHLYVKGQFHKPHCHRNFSSEYPQRSIDMVLLYDKCHSKRDRSVSPQGITYSITIVVQFHRLFITKDDRAFNLVCFYGEETQQATQGFSVEHPQDDSRPLQETELKDNGKMPQCHYSVHRSTLNGPIVRFAHVGDRVFHKWNCTEGRFGMLVHSCYAQDHVGDHYKLIDKEGCAVDPVLLNDLTYTSTLSVAYTEVEVFKFADAVHVKFTCQISLCFKEMDGCGKRVPPRCKRQSAPKPTSWRTKRSLNDTFAYNDTVKAVTEGSTAYEFVVPRPDQEETIDVAAQDIIIMDDLAPVKQPYDPSNLPTFIIPNPDVGTNQLCTEKLTWIYCLAAVCVLMALTIALLLAFGLRHNYTAPANV